MAQRWGLLVLGSLAAILHAVAIAQTLLPSQDGLKLIRVARRFQVEPWSDVVRGCDAHPLYPALIAAVEPAVARFIGHGPDAWRIAAQSVSALAAVGLMLPLYLLTRSLFDGWIALPAVLFTLFLPRLAELGRETLADSLGLFTTFLALALGARALRTGDRRIALGSGLAAGVGYLARPEVILVPVAIGVTWLTGLGWKSWRTALGRLPAVCVLIAAAGVILGSYTLVKGEVSEKLAVRRGGSLGPQRIWIRPVPQQVPRGLDDPRWDFSAKEETDRVPISGWGSALALIVANWWEELCWFFAVMTIWGVARRRFIRSLLPDRGPDRLFPKGDRHLEDSEPVPFSETASDDSGGIEGRLLLVFAVVYSLALVRHSAILGYLSGRHVMPLLIASLPWAAGGTYVCGRGLARILGWGPRLAGSVGIGVLGAAIAVSMLVQMRPSHLNHLSRWGHWAAGRWLAEHARPNELMLDTRGWARFISGRPGYDYWHVRQALTDSHLSYVLVGLDELEADSPRATTLKALLAYAATPLVDFPAEPGRRSPAVRLYRFRQPSSWEGLAR